MLGERRLDLGRIHVAAAHGEHVHAPVGEEEEAFVAIVDVVAEVAERIPAVAALGRRPDVAVGRRLPGEGRM